jgi:hypothetical protein
MKAKAPDPPAPKAPDAIEVMRWQIGGTGWPVGQFMVPPGTVLTAVVSGGEIVPPVWNSVALPMPPPIDASALDEQAALFMLKSYPEELWYRLVFDRSVDRDLMLTRAKRR